MERDRFAEMVWEFEVGCRLPDREPRLELAGRDHPLGAGYRQGTGEAIRVRELVVGHGPDRTSLTALRPTRVLAGQFSGVPENDLRDPQNPADFYERNRRILRVPFGGGVVEFSFASAVAEVGASVAGLFTRIRWFVHTVALAGSGISCPPARHGRRPLVSVAFPVVSYANLAVAESPSTGAEVWSRC